MRPGHAFGGRAITRLLRAHACGALPVAPTEYLDALVGSFTRRECCLTGSYHGA